MDSVTDNDKYRIRLRLFAFFPGTVCRRSIHGHKQNQQYTKAQQYSIFHIPINFILRHSVRPPLSF